MTVNLKAELFIRLLYYFNKRPLSQDKIKLGVAEAAVHTLLKGLDPMPLTEYYSQWHHRDGMYSIYRYKLVFCLGCGRNHFCELVKTTTPFVTECWKCTENLDSFWVELTTPNEEERKYFNPCLSIFPKLDKKLQHLILDKMLDRVAPF